MRISAFKKTGIMLLVALLLFQMTQIFAVTQDDLKATQKELDAANQKLADINAQIKENESQIQLNAALLPQKQAEYDDAVAQVASRSKALYMTDSADVLTYIFTSKDLGELLNHLESLNTIGASDMAMLKRVDAAKNSLQLSSDQIAASKQALEEQKKEAEALKQKYGDQLKEQQTALGVTGTTANASLGSSPSYIKDIAASSSPRRQKLVDIMVALCNDNSNGYQFAGKNPPDMDCSGSIIYSLRTAGFETGGAAAADSLQAVCNYGWIKVPVSELAAGDILINESSHAALYIGGGQVAEFSSDYDGVSGDSSGQEAWVQAYYSFPGDYALRYPGND